jgi:hypothetical protein
VTDGLAPDPFDPAAGADPSGTDPFNTGGLRARVLDGWTASASRFREDANAEEDYALGGYRDRVVVELAQNAADAAVRGGVPGRLRLTLRDGVLVAANTGAPLDAAGVEALSTLRASSKRDDGTGGSDGSGGETVGRFGVGFAAVVAVSEAPRIHSATGSVAWSRERTRELVDAIPALAGEVAARSGHVPVLRLPFAVPSADRPSSGGPSSGGPSSGGPSSGGPSSGGLSAGGLAGDGFVTAVELPLRDDAAVELVTRLLAETGPALLLALPALTHVEITAGGITRVLTSVHDGDQSAITVDGVPSAWRVASAGGSLDPALLADRPAEERLRTWWSVRWAVPVSASGAPSGRLPAGVAAVLHGPTPTDEPLSLPALLLASFPLSPDRRHVAPGPLADFLADRAADAYADLLPGLAPGPGLLDLVPGPVGRGELDARIGGAIVSRLPGVAFLPGVGGDPEADAVGDIEVGDITVGRVRPRDAVLLSSAAPALPGWLAPVLPHLVAGPARHPAWAVLGVRRMPLAELADLLAALEREPAWWHGLYQALGELPAEERAELGALPVPLADGRLVRGPRGLLLPGPGLEHAGGLAVLGLRVVDPAAAHPLLARLGAVEATPRSVLEDPATRAAVENSRDSAVEAAYDDDSPRRLADAVLGLLARLDVEPGEYPWLAELALPGADGGWYAAGELLLPGAPLADVLAADASFGTASDELVERHGAGPLLAAGAAWSFGLLRAEDVELDPGQIDLELDGADDWAASTGERVRGASDDAPLPPTAIELTAVRDLDLVDPDRWPQALGLLSRPPLRAALIDPFWVLLPLGGAADVPSYTAWWLRRHVLLGGRRPSGLRVADADPLLAGLYDVAGDEPALSGVLADPAIARALGVRSSLAGLLAEPGGADELLARLAEPERPVTRLQLRALWSALASVPADELRPDDISPPEQVRAVHGDKVTVADAADVLVLDAPDLWPLVAGRPLVLVPYRHATRLADLLDLPLASEEVPGAVESAGERRPAPATVTDVLPAAPAAYVEHDSLVVDDTDLPWRYLDGELHAATTEGLAHGLAWAAGRWQDRHLLSALLMSPEETTRLLAEADLDV